MSSRLVPYWFIYWEGVEGEWSPSTKGARFSSSNRTMHRTAWTTVFRLVLLLVLIQGTLATLAVAHAAQSRLTDPSAILPSSSGVVAPSASVNVRSLLESQRLQSQQSQPTPRTISVSSASSVSPSVLATTNSATTVDPTAGFVGLGQAQSCTCAPPDVQIAAGPDKVVEMVNLEVGIYSKQGIVNRTLTLASLFNTGSDFISDPKVLFDQPSGRWFSSIVDVTLGSVRVAVSASSDPTGTWVLYNLSSNDCPDQPTIGISDDKFVVSGNDFTNQCSGSFVGDQYWVLNKSQMVSGASVNFSSVGPNSGLFSAHPAQSLSSTTTQYLISLIVSHSRLVTTSVKLLGVTGVPGVSTVSTTTTTMGVSTLSIPPAGVQPGTSSTIDTADFRPQDVVWFSGKLWFGLNDACTPAGDSQARSCVRLTQLNTGTSPASLVQDFDLGINGNYLFYPSLRPDGLGNVILVYGYSGSTVYPSIALAGQKVGDPVDSLGPSVTVAKGSTSDTSTRFGDYFGSGVDPSDPSTIWLSGEYHDASTGTCGSQGSCWSTFIASATLQGTFSLSVTPTSVTLTEGASTQVSVTVAGANGFAGNISEVASVLPIGPVLSFSPSTVILTSSATTAISSLSIGAMNVQPGTYTITATGTSGLRSQSSVILLTVSPPSAGGGGAGGIIHPN